MNASASLFGPTDVMLDNQANVSIFRTNMLRDIFDAEETVKINGVGGHQFSVTKTGFLDPLFRVYASDDMHANILSLSEVEEKYFIVHLPTTDIVFHRKGGMYIADWSQYKNAFTTVNTGVGTYTMAEEARARQAYELLRTSGYPSIQEAIHIIQDGNITDMPTLTVEDLRRAYEIFGTPPAYVRGKMTKKRVSRAVIDQHIVFRREKTGTDSGCHAHR